MMLRSGPQRSVLLAGAADRWKTGTGEKMVRSAASGPNQIRSFSGIIRGSVASLVLIAPALAWPAAASAGDKFTACTRLDICYCVNSDYRDAISANVARVRQLIAARKAEGKSIGYLSIPLSPAGGGSFTLNSRIAGKVAEKVTARFGARSMFLLNPGAEAGDKMNGASGADFMYMWTQILEGPTGLGEDFDFFYFGGPTDFGKTFGLTGQGDLEALEAWFDTNAAADSDLKKSIDQDGVAKTKAAFRSYYGLRASVAYSYGSHDEWNIARLINVRRRGATDFGIANQLAIFFDGQPQSPGGYEDPTAPGDTGRCVK
jgi:hypothetical protein